MLVVFSQAFAVIITPSNICQNFSINSVEGVGCIAVPEEFKGMFKLKLKNHYAHGRKIQQRFYKYIISTLQLNDSETEQIHKLIIHDNYESSRLIPFEDLLSIIRLQ